jgi:hypothetical protein
MLVASPSRVLYCSSLPRGVDVSKKADLVLTPAPATFVGVDASVAIALWHMCRTLVCMYQNEQKGHYYTVRCRCGPPGGPAKGEAGILTTGLVSPLIPPLTPPLTSFSPRGDCGDPRLIRC